VRIVYQIVSVCEQGRVKCMFLCRYCLLYAAVCNTITAMRFNDPSETVYGIELEYSSMIGHNDGEPTEIVGSCHSIDEQIGLYMEPKRSGANTIPESVMTRMLQEQGIYRNDNGMLSNGGRMYNDPSGIEYDTPETTTAAEAVLRSFDGDSIVFSAIKKLSERGFIGDYQLNRRIVDHNRSSRGVHLNHTTFLNEMPTPQVINALATLNVLKGALFGSGGLLIDEKGNTAFHHSPRLSLTNKLSDHYGYYTSRPLVRTPFKQDGSKWRVESVTSDALSFAWPMRASLVVTNAVLGMIEMGHLYQLPMLRRPVAAAHTVGQYGNGQFVSLYVDNERTGIKPLDGLKLICESVMDVDDKTGYLDNESSQVIPEIIEVADMVKKDWRKAARDVESVARLVAMDRRMRRDSKRLEINSEVMCRFDYAWDLIGGMGIAQQLRDGKNQVGWRGFDINRLPSATKARWITPPKDTRAHVRGNAIKNGKGDMVSDWTHIDGDYFTPLYNL
jgi:hypothetical protein